MLLLLGLSNNTLSQPFDSHLKQSSNWNRQHKALRGALSPSLSLSHSLSLSLSLSISPSLFFSLYPSKAFGNYRLGGKVLMSTPPNGGTEMLDWSAALRPSNWLRDVPVTAQTLSSARDTNPWFYSSYCPHFIGSIFSTFVSLRKVIVCGCKNVPAGPDFT